MGYVSGKTVLMNKYDGQVFVFLEKVVCYGDPCYILMGPSQRGLDFALYTVNRSSYIYLGEL